MSHTAYSFMIIDHQISVWASSTNIWGVRAEVKDVYERKYISSYITGRWTRCSWIKCAFATSLDIQHLSSFSKDIHFSPFFFEKLSSFWNEGVLKLSRIVPTLSLCETMSFEKVHEPIILPDESHCGGRLCRPDHFVSSFFDVLFFIWFSLPTQIPLIIIISCPRISIRSLHPRLTTYSYERDSRTVRARLEHHLEKTDLWSRFVTSIRNSILKDTLLDSRFDGYVAAAVLWRSDVAVFGRQQPSKRSLSNILSFCAWLSNVIDGHPV